MQHSSRRSIFAIEKCIYKLNNHSILESCEYPESTELEQNKAIYLSPNPESKNIRLQFSSKKSMLFSSFKLALYS